MSTVYGMFTAASATQTVLVQENGPKQSHFGTQGKEPLPMYSGMDMTGWEVIVVLYALGLLCILWKVVDLIVWVAHHVHLQWG